MKNDNINLEEIIREEVTKFLTEKSYLYSNLKKDPNSFWRNPTMAGHNWAIETIDAIERLANKYNSHKLQRFILNNVFDFDVAGDTGFHYFLNQYSKKYLSQIQYVLRHIKTEQPIQLLLWLENKPGVLKSELNWCLEYLAFKMNHDEYLKYYQQTMGFFGMSREESEARLNRYISNLKNKVKEDYS